MPSGLTSVSTEPTTRFVAASISVTVFPSRLVTHTLPANAVMTCGLRSVE